MSSFRISLLMLVLFCQFSFLKSNDSIPSVINGKIDVGNWNFAKSDITLSGQWEFYWDQLLEPADFQNVKTEPEYIKVPASWSSAKAGAHNMTGKATYRLKIETNGLEGTYGIRLYDLFSASKVWFNGMLVYQTGQTGVDKKASKPGFAYEDVPVFIDKDKNEQELVIQVSNYHHRRSGLVKIIKFGPYDTLTDYSKRFLILNLLIIGIILIISFNHLLNYFLYKNEITNLFFGLLCLVMVLRNVSTGQRIITFLIPDINWQLLFKLDNFSGFGTIPLFAIFLYIIYAKEFPKFLLKLFVAIGVVITAVVVFTPQMVYGRLRMFFELYILFGGLFLTYYVLVRAAIRKREGAFLTFIGFFILYGTAINDVLISMGIIRSIEVAPFGLVVYMLLQSFVLSRGSALAVEENRKLGLAIQHEKVMLEARVSERTRELEERNLEIIMQQDALKNQAWLNQSLTRVNAVLNQYNKSDIETLSHYLINEILDLLNAQVGVIYIINDDENEPKLERVATRNLSSQNRTSTEFSPGEGLLGACFLEKKVKLLNNFGEAYIKLDSGLGEMILKNLVLVPLHTNMVRVGVIEIASYKEFEEKQIELLEKISESISSTIQFIRLNRRNEKLLEEYQQKGSDLDRSEQEMRQQIEELQALKEQLESLKQQ